MKQFLFAPHRLGITLVEMLVGMAVLGVVLAAAIPSLTGLIERRRVVAAAGEIAGVFTQARSEANVLGRKVDVHLEQVPTDVGEFSCIRLTTVAPIDNCGCNVPLTETCAGGGTRVLREFLLPKSTSVEFSAAASWGMRGRVVSFHRNANLAFAGGVHVTVTGMRTGAKLTVEYNNGGRVRTCSPQGTMSGYPACA